MTPSPRSQFFAGIKAIFPILLGVVPFAAISGIAAVDVGIPPGLAVGMSLIVFAGAAQLAAIQLIAVGASPLIIVLTTFLINMRFSMYAASLAPHLKGVAGRWKYLLAYLLTDQAYAMAITRYNAAPEQPHKPWYYTGAATVMWLTWQVCTVAGVFLGTQVPKSWSLDFAVPLTFMVLLVPAIKGRPGIAAALTAGTAAVLGFKLPYNLGLIVAALSGIGAGLLVETLLAEKK
jgi:4-azaleucine resistance transporter AzlC